MAGMGIKGSRRLKIFMILDLIWRMLSHTLWRKMPPTNRIWWCASLRSKSVLTWVDRFSVIFDLCMLSAAAGVKAALRTTINQ